MLDIGFSELILIAVVGLVVIGPKDLPVVIRHVVKFLRELRGFYDGMKGQMHQLMEEAGVDDLRQNVTTIIDMDGNPQKTYDVRELESLKTVPGGAAGDASPPAGEATRLSASALSRSGEGASSGAHNFNAPSSQPSPARGEGALASPPVTND